MPTPKNKKQKVVILLHGMGFHPKKHESEEHLTFEQEVIKAANTALGRYDSFSDIKFNEKVILEPIYYDHIFEKHRNEMAQDASGIQEAIKQHLPEMNVPNIMSRLLKFEQKLGKDKFEYTHVLDVILYLTLTGGEVRAFVAAEMAKIINKYNDYDICVVAHSLGTAIAHDVMDMIFTTNKNENGKFPISSHKIHTYWAFANVSDVVRIMSGKRSPYKSIVKPGSDGCLSNFNNVFNKFDPFVMELFFRFEPSSDGDWLPKFVYDNFFANYELEQVSRQNTHSIFGYIEDPKVCHDFLNTFFKFQPEGEEKTKGDAKYKTVQREFDNIKSFITKMESYQDIVTLLKMMKEFSEYVKSV